MEEVLKWIILIGSTVGGLLTIGKACKKVCSRVYDATKFVETMKDEIEKSKEESEKRRLADQMIFKALFTIHDGLIQMKCNGPVTKMRKELESFIIENWGE